MNSSIPPAVSADTPLYSQAFLLLCLSHGLFAGSFNMMVPELPSYLNNMGGGEHKGWIIALFALAAGISRPYSGKLADTIGRMPVMYVGVFTCVVCGMLYPPLNLVTGFLTLRFFHGFSTGFKPTGTAAYVADIVPMHRRGEAMGMLGICFSVGGAAAPPLGSWITMHWSINAMFYASSVLAGLSLLVMIHLKETLPETQKFKLSLLRISKDDIYDPLVIPAGIVMVFCYFSYGVILTLVPDLSDSVGVVNRGTFFTLFTLSSVSTRMFAGRISDKHGREPVLQVSALVIALAMLAFARTHSPAMLYLASVLFGLGNGIFAPAINAWSVDLGNPARKGRALATMYIALEIAIGVGAAASGWYFANALERMPAVFYLSAALSFCGFVYLWRRGRKVPKP